MWPLLALSTLSPIESADHELDVEIRSTRTEDASFDRFNDANGFGTWGLRGAYALSPNLKIAGSWSHGGRGKETTVGLDSYRAQYKMETVGLGLRGGWLYRGIIGPTGTFQVLGLLGTARFDEDASRNDNSGQYVRRGVGIGGSLTAGIEARVPTYRWAEPAFSLELGHLLTSQIGLGDVGNLRFGGFTARGTMGMRFR